VSDPPPARDAALEAFAAALEEALRARRGTEHVLSPRDFALARGWHEAGVSLATVLVAIDAAFERDPSTASLALCRRRVEELAGSSSRAGAPLEAERATLPEVAERLDALRERLEELPGRAAALPLAELAEVSDLVAVASRPNWHYLRQKLRRIDGLVTDAAVEALPPEAAAACARSRRAPRAAPGPGRRAALATPLAPLRQRAREAFACPGVDRPAAKHPCRTRSARHGSARHFLESRRWIWGPGPLGVRCGPAPTTQCQGTRPCASGSARSAQPTARAPRGTPNRTATWP
jgi:hypothetical protein